MEDPNKMTDTIMQAVKSCGVRAIVSRGWSKLGEGRSDPDIIFIGDCPHGKYKCFVFCGLTRLII